MLVLLTMLLAHFRLAAALSVVHMAHLRSILLSEAGARVAVGGQRLFLHLQSTLKAYLVLTMGDAACRFELHVEAIRMLDKYGPHIDVSAAEYYAVDLESVSNS